jgi:hypothetical protein
VNQFGTSLWPPISDSQRYSRQQGASRMLESEVKSEKLKRELRESTSKIE